MMGEEGGRSLVDDVEHELEPVEAVGERGGSTVTRDWSAAARFAAAACSNPLFLRPR